eukprot:TRINITY_DN1394_c1_g1_i1.p1 TRINITY_DN1394_c1_g1~~TRINITY_DN1394_c1_g1_i1.p1  ORF type:complete len:230 (-),score=32.67 TRINITY_DN1394_c1_g1_i1:32-670(-)
MGNTASTTSTIHTIQGTWTHLPSIDSITGREGHSMAVAGDSLWIFGGQSHKGEPNNELIRIPLDDLTTSNPHPTSQITQSSVVSQRAFHAMSVVGHSLFVHGGVENSQIEFFDDAARLDISTGEWESMVLIGDTPGVRFGHGMITLDEQNAKVLCFGGHDGSQCLNDVFIIDVRTRFAFFQSHQNSQTHDFPYPSEYVSDPLFSLFPHSLSF